MITDLTYTALCCVLLNHPLKEVQAGPAQGREAERALILSAMRNEESEDYHRVSGISIQKLWLSKNMGFPVYLVRLVVYKNHKADHWPGTSQTKHRIQQKLCSCKAVNL